MCKTIRRLDEDEMVETFKGPVVGLPMGSSIATKWSVSCAQTR